MVALPKLFAKSASSLIAPSEPAKGATAEAMPVNVKVETRAVARRDDTL